jgi:hypothetical protein
VVSILKDYGWAKAEAKIAAKGGKVMWSGVIIYKGLGFIMDLLGVGACQRLFAALKKG